jgi:hypothetical protein
MPGRRFCFMLDVIGPAPLIHNVKRAEATLGAGARGVRAWPTGRGSWEGGEADMMTS